MFFVDVFCRRFLSTFVDFFVDVFHRPFFVDGFCRRFFVAPFFSMFFCRHFIVDPLFSTFFVDFYIAELCTKCRPSYCQNTHCRPYIHIVETTFCRLQYVPSMHLTKKLPNTCDCVGLLRGASTIRQGWQHINSTVDNMSNFEN
jgi:hypothetical protein